MNYAVSPSCATASSAELYRSGPWLVPFAYGLAAEDLARTVCAVCETRGVEAHVVPVDETHRIDLARYPGMITVLPTDLRSGVSIEEVVQSSVILLDAYRARRPHGLRDLHTGKYRWYDVGVAQAVGPRDILEHPDMKRRLVNRACARHHTDAADFEPACVFRPYESPDSPVIITTPAATPVGGGVPLLWSVVQSWQVTDPGDIPTLRAIIEQVRQHFENPKFSALHRPIEGVQLNRFDLLLKGTRLPEASAPEQKKFSENGARTWRYARGELRKIVPTLDRPRRGTKDAQLELRQFYRALCLLDEYLRSGGSLAGR